MGDKKGKTMDNGKPPDRIKDGGGKQQPSNQACPCKSCKKTISNVDAATQCSICDDYYCLQCIGMSAKEYKALSTLDRKDVWWTCKQCLPTLMAIRNNTSVLEVNLMESQVSKKVNQLESTMTTFMETVTTTVNKLEHSVAATLDTKIEANHEKVQQTVTNISQECEKTIQETVHTLTESCEKQIAKSFKQALSGKPRWQRYKCRRKGRQAGKLHWYHERHHYIPKTGRREIWAR